MTVLPPEPEVLIARQAFPDAQAQLAGPTTVYSGELLTLGWYGTRLSDERGSFALVQDGGDFEELVGEILLLRYGARSVYVYCAAASDIADYDIAISRRSFTALGSPANDELPVLVEVVR